MKTLFLVLSTKPYSYHIMLSLMQFHGSHYYLGDSRRKKLEDPKFFLQKKVSSYSFANTGYDIGGCLLIIQCYHFCGLIRSIITSGFYCSLCFHFFQLDFFVVVCILWLYFPFEFSGVRLVVWHTNPDHSI
jgi:hypothetical protein